MGVWQDAIFGNVVLFPILVFVLVRLESRMDRVDRSIENVRTELHDVATAILIDNLNRDTSPNVRREITRMLKERGIEVVPS